RTDQELAHGIQSEPTWRLFCREYPDGRKPAGVRVDTKSGNDVCAAHACVDEAAIGAHMDVGGARVAVESGWHHRLVLQLSQRARAGFDGEGGDRPGLLRHAVKDIL